MFPGYPATSPALPLYSGSEITESQGHDVQKLSATRDEGGNFYNKKTYGKAKPYRMGLQIEVPLTTTSHDRGRWNDSRAFMCPIEVTGQGKPAFPASLESSDESLADRGADAVALCSPVSGGAELSTALGEALREGLPSLVGLNTWRDRTRGASSAGDEYLNVQFGWVPLLSEINAVASQVSNSGKLLNQYIRDQGRPVRRQFTFPEIKTETEILLNPSRAPIKAPNASSSVFPSSLNGALYRKETTKIKRWFSGCFQYGPPVSNTFVQSGLTTAQEADYLLGLNLDPATLWNLAPWSWAIDWVANVGNVLENISSMMTHGQVLRYGYMMEHTVHSYEYTLIGATHMGRALPNLTAKLVTETKKRVRANPFGFGVSWDGLSAAQYAILAALGISRT
jgi:hypothetical protein